jgi:NADPH2:quinone reductase
MRAFQLDAFEGPSALRLTTTADPQRSGEAVVVRVKAIGVNFPDLLTTRGQLPNLPDLPTIPGREIAGIVEQSAGDSVWKPGQAVVGYVESGGYGEQVAVPQDRIMALPAGADFATGVALVINYHTAYFALHTRGGLVKGETVLVLGAGGGVGSAAVQVARALGARVIAGVADDDQAATASSVGADATVLLTEGFASRVRAMTDDGVDVLLDPLGGSLFGETLGCLAPEGRLLVLGFAAGGVPSLRTNRLLMRNVAVLGVTWTGPMRGRGPTFAETGHVLTGMYERKLLRPHVGARYSFEELPMALERLERGGVPGKAVAEFT